MGVSVGIDLGTTFSAVAVVDDRTKLPRVIPNQEGAKITPSVIQFLDGNIIFGSEAESAFNAGELGCAATFKRSMGSDEVYCVADGHAYTAEDLSSLLLKHLKEDAEAELGQPIQDAVITVPAYFYSPEREATIRAATAAGIKVKKIIDEPNAAAMAYGLNNWRENANILVYDLGGGTFDVTLIHMEKNGELKTIVTRGDHLLGGRDWDNRIESLLIDKFEQDTELDLREDAEATSIIRGLTEGVKKQLTVMENVTVKASFPDYGASSVVMTRKEFDDSTQDLIDRTGMLCWAVLEEAGLKKSDLTDILLVGGSTRMPQVSKYLLGQFNKKPITHVNPDEAVALGAAIQATKDDAAYVKLAVKEQGGKKVTNRAGTSLTRLGAVQPAKRLSDIKQLRLQETTAHAMGMIAVSQDGTRYINDIIIPANHPRPVRAAKAFSFQTRARVTNEMEIFVLQGDKTNPLDCSIPYKYVVSGIKHNRETRGKTVIKVQYSYDNNGVIHVEARQENEKVSLPIRREPVPDDMSKFGLPIDKSEMKPASLNVVLAIDVSGSMSGSPIEDAKRAMCDFVMQMDFSYTQVAILAVSDRTTVVCGLSDDEETCISAIKSIVVGQTGYGNAAHPFDDIYNIMRDEDGRLFAIVLADGVWDYQDRAISAAKRCNEASIETAAIGFGSADYQFLQAISSEDANALFVSQAELTSAFGTIAQSLGGSSEIQGENKFLSAKDIETWDD